MHRIASNKDDSVAKICVLSFPLHVNDEKNSVARPGMK